MFASILNSSVMLDNYLQQTTSADDIFRCIFFLDALRVKVSIDTLFTHTSIYKNVHSHIHMHILAVVVTTPAMSPTSTLFVKEASKTF